MNDGKRKKLRQMLRSQQESQLVYLCENRRVPESSVNAQLFMTDTGLPPPNSCTVEASRLCRHQVLIEIDRGAGWKSQQKSVTTRSIKPRANQSRPTIFVSGLRQSGRSSPPTGPLLFATVLAFVRSDWGFRV